ncbi:DUF1631 family protein [Pseudoduganella sp.]|uniref:DUF1631 family protein n=1 Tax=Pseudoduganella sp. TaxID=1880898 RepID=UPI0035AE173B
MQTLKRVLALALEEAQTGFATLCRRMTDRADEVLGEAVRTAPAGEQRAPAACRVFLREQGATLRARMERAYAGLLARAMQTMHTDLRTGLHDFRADTLTLVDDDVMTRQIEVERLLLRLRDADELSLGHLNLIIAQMHGDSEVRERENPFRPYLLARTLYDALHSMVEDEAHSKLLFDTLSQTMTAELGDFYTRLREVFESRGIRSRLLARPSALGRRERERRDWQRAAAGLADADQAMRRRVAALGAVRQHVEPNQELQELVYSLFNPAGLRRGTRAAQAPAQLQLDGALRQLQHEHASASAAGAPAPLALRERLAGLPPGPQRVVAELAGMLFEFILNDELLQPALRAQLCRLHTPFLRAALQDQSVLQNADHPARRLLDRIGSAAAGIGASSPLLAPLQGEVQRLVERVLQQYEHDPAVFADAELEFDGFLASLLRECEPAVRRCMPAFERAAQVAPQVAAIADTLRGQLETVSIDRRMVDFISGTWAQVMAHTQGSQPGFSQLLPELVWSGQEKQAPEERAALMKLLPGLGRQLRAGLAAIGMPEGVAQAALDQLVSLHMDVMANKLAPATTPRLSIAALRERLGASVAQALAAHDAGGADALPGHDHFRAEFALHGQQATVQPDPVLASAAHDEEWLQWARAGNGFELLSGGSYLPLRLDAVTARNAGFLFTGAGLPAPLVYSRAALLAAMREGSLRPLEYAPLFERAVESLMTGAESLDASR